MASPSSESAFALGWMLYLPGIARDLYLLISDLREFGERATDQVIGWVSVVDDGRNGAAELDLPYDPRRAGDADNQCRWDALSREAARRGLALHTPRDVLTFMRAVGLLEGDGTFGWRLASPPPRIIETVELSPAELARQVWLERHWRYLPALRIVLTWIERQSAGSTRSVRTSLLELTERLPLTADEIRNALVLIHGQQAALVSPSPDQLRGADQAEICLPDGFAAEQQAKRDLTAWVRSLRLLPASLD